MLSLWRGSVVSLQNFYFYIYKYHKNVMSKKLQKWFMHVDMDASIIEL